MRYLFAIDHGAKFVWDFDDDNELLACGPPLHQTGLSSSARDGRVAACRLAHDTFPTFNPYPMLGAPHSPVWPRGLPLESIRAGGSAEQRACTDQSIAISSIGCYQALAHHDPDVDAIYRLTMPIPFDWDERARVGSGGERPLVLPHNTFAPANAQATLHTRTGLWATLLPRTVHGRVSDIWRSYIAQRLFWDVGLSLAFVGAHVTQFRSPHNYLADFDAEADLYAKAGTLVRFLHDWRGRAPTLAGRMEELYVALYERGYLDLDDVLLAQNWLSALESVGYKFPLLVSARAGGTSAIP